MGPVLNMNPWVVLAEVQVYVKAHVKGHTEAHAEVYMLKSKPSNIVILLKTIKDNQNIDNISIIKNNKGYFK